MVIAYKRQAVQYTNASIMENSTLVYTENNEMSKYRQKLKFQRATRRGLQETAR